MPVQAEVVLQRTLDLQPSAPKPKRLSRKGIPTGAKWHFTDDQLTKLLLELHSRRDKAMLLVGKPRQNIVYVSAERSRPCWTNITHRIDTCWLSRFEGPLLCTMRLWGLLKRMFPKQGRLHSALM